QQINKRTREPKNPNCAVAIGSANIPAPTEVPTINKILPINLKSILSLLLKWPIHYPLGDWEAKKNEAEKSELTATEGVKKKSKSIPNSPHCDYSIGSANIQAPTVEPTHNKIMTNNLKSIITLLLKWPISNTLGDWEAKKNVAEKSELPATAGVKIISKRKA